MTIPMRHLTRLRLLAIALASLWLVACGDSANTTSQPEIIGRALPVSYTGSAPPANEDVVAFQREVWSNLAPLNRCGTCHASSQSPLFVRGDNINLAYNAVLPLVDLVNPEDSLLVRRVAGGHNCWNDDTDICEEVMTEYIRRWANASVGGPASTVVLVAPPEYVPGQTKNFPPDSALFGSTVWPVVNAYCSGCHAPNARNPQAPYFAQDDIDAAYDAARNTISLNVPENSRLVVRLRDENHNCWNNNCPAAAAEMLLEIQNMAGAIVPTSPPPETIASRALGLREGIVATTGGRHEADIIAKYQFKEGSGTVAHDTSGISPSLDLNLRGSVTWATGWGLNFTGGKAQGSTLASQKLHDRITTNGEYSIEIWVNPANQSQDGPARIVSYSGGEDVRNFMLGQSMYNYDFLNRNAGSDGNGEPAMSTADADQRVQLADQHVVLTYSAASGRRIYVNGGYTGDMDTTAASALGNWNNSFALVLGSEVDGSNPFRGKISMVAVHGRALSAEQVAQNFAAGVGERFFLLFGIGHLIDVPGTYVMLQGSLFDDYSYLLSAPKVVNLSDPNWSPSGIPLAGMRIGINGRIPEIGQAFATLDTEIDASRWIPGSGQDLSRIGTVIPLENGPDFDQLFLSFERLGDLENVQTPSMSPAPPPAIGTPVSDIGLRLFETINATLSEITTVPTTNTNVSAMYERVKQQLPASELVTGFSSAQQIGITQLAIEYCNELVEDPISSVYFSGLNLGAPYGTALDSAGERSALIDPLLLHLANSGLTSMPVIDDMKTELDALVTRLVNSCSGSCTTDPVGRTQTIAKAVCAAASANAAMLIQ